MSTFSVTALCLDDVREHPNADRLELAVIGGYQSVIPKGVYQANDLVVYVPESAVLPDWLIEQQNLVGKLSGSRKNRVKAIKLRGVLSQGLVIGLEEMATTAMCGAEYALKMPSGVIVEEGQDVAELLGITKYEPPIPTAMMGELKSLFGVPMNYDIENLKRFPDVLQDEEMVMVTEKLHGTFCQIGWKRDLKPDPELFGDGRVYVCSKGLGGKGLVFKNNEVNKSNVYVRAMRDLGLFDALAKIGLDSKAEKLVIMGEVFGDVQDLKYGMKRGQISFRVFELVDDSGFVNAEMVGKHTDAMNMLYDLNIQWVPNIGVFPWGLLKNNLDKYTRGESVIAPGQIREGIVIRPLVERRDDTLGRVILKSVSEDYLLRNNADATELA